MMHILILTTGWTDENGQFRLSKYMNKMDFTFDSAPPSTSFIINATNCIFQTLRALPIIKGYDALLSMSIMNGIYYSSICRFLRRMKIPHVTIDIGAPRFVKNSSFLKNTIRFGVSNVDQIICSVSSKMIFWSKVIGLPNKVKFIPEGVNPDTYLPNFQGGGNYIISVGRAARDYATLFSAIKDLNTQLVAIIGADPIQNRAESELFHSKVESPLPNVKIMRDVPPPLTRKMVADSRFVVLSLLDIPYGSGGIRVLLESMALGKAVVATRVHHTIDYIRNFDTGIFSEPNDPKDLADKIFYLLDSPNEAERIGRNARRMVEEKFNERRWALEVQETIIDATRENKC